MILLTDARKRAEKKKAKRIANRKSACTSRARKKALVQQMTELNVRLRRQALILSLLPDLVIVVDESCKIAFCSAQVERVLQHSINDLTGAKLIDIVLPESRAKLLHVIQNLLSDHVRSTSNKKAKLTPPKESSSGNQVTESSFPMSVVNLDPGRQVVDENDISDTSASGGKQPSSLTSLSNQGSRTEETKGPPKSKDQSSSDLSNSGDESKNFSTLERNVRAANKKKTSPKFTDDVTGAAVTANNATARLSSLQHHSGLSSSEEDSGYRQSNDSREETSSSSEGEVYESKGECRIRSSTNYSHRQ